MAKYIIRFSPDYGSTSLWSVSDNAYANFGTNISYEAAGLSADLIKRLEKFDDSVCGLVDWDDPGGDCPLTDDERNKIYEEGKQLLQMVRAELGADFEVIDKLDWINPKSNI